MTPSFRSRTTALFALVVATACATSDPDVSPSPEPAVASAPGASVCAPKGYITENIETAYADLFTANDAKSVSRRKGMKIERLKLARISTVDDEATCARAVHALAPREPAAAAALGGARGVEVARKHRRNVLRVQLALEQVLDRLEHGESRPSLLGMLRV